MTDWPADEVFDVVSEVLDEREAARALAATALESIPVTHTTIDAAVMLKYRPVVAYNGPWEKR